MRFIAHTLITLYDARNGELGPSESFINFRLVPVTLFFRLFTKFDKSLALNEIDNVTLRDFFLT